MLGICALKAERLETTNKEKTMSKDRINTAREIHLTDASGNIREIHLTDASGNIVAVFKAEPVKGDSNSAIVITGDTIGHPIIDERKEEIKKTAEKSIDTLQQFYSTIVALAVGSWLRTLVPLLQDAFHNNDTEQVWKMAAISIAFLSTIVPFYHGMNRHLYESHVHQFDTEAQSHPGWLLVDVFAFILESGLLFAMGLNIDKPNAFLLLWTSLLIFDIIWSVAIWKIKKGDNPRWAKNNFILLSIAWGFWLGLSLLTESLLVKACTLAVIEVIRSIRDYRINWRYYFPWACEKQDKKSDA